MVGSQLEARQLKDAYIGTEHFLLSVINPSGLFARIIGQPLTIGELKTAGLSYADVRGAVEWQGKRKQESYVAKGESMFATPLGYWEPLSTELTDALYAATLIRTPVEPSQVLHKILDTPGTRAANVLASLTS